MPKATLTFSLPEEREEYDLARKGMDYSIAIDEFRNFLRYRYKHVEPPCAAAEKEFEEIQTKFFEIMNDNKVFED